MTENQNKLIAFNNKYFSQSNMKLLSQKVHGDEESFKNVQEELNFLVEEHESYLDTLNFEAVGFNEGLVKSQKVQEDGIKDLVLLNVLKLLVNKSILDYDKFAPDELAIMKNLGELIYPMETVAQHLWKFDQDDTKHTWWYQLDACECPVLDNQDMFGVDRAYINMSCPLHGDLTKVLQEKEEAIEALVEVHDASNDTETDIYAGEVDEVILNAYMDNYEVLLTDGRVLDIDTNIDAHGASGFGYMMESCEKNISIREFLKKFCTFKAITPSEDAYLIANRGTGIFTNSKRLWASSSYIKESQLRPQFAGNYENGDEIPAFGNFQFILRKKV